MYDIKEIARLVSGKINGNENLVLKKLSPFFYATEDELTFAADEKMLKNIEKCNAGAIVVPPLKNLPKDRLLMPLDVHTHRVSLNLGLINRKSYDFKAVMELTKKLREFDELDPIKYDFALYRIGQSKELETIVKNLKK